MHIIYFINFRNCKGGVNWENVHKSLEYQLSKPDHASVFGCKLCNVFYNKKIILKNHVKQKHPFLNLDYIEIENEIQNEIENEIQTTLFKCEPCNMIFTQELDFNKHVQTKHPYIEYEIQEI